MQERGWTRRKPVLIGLSIYFWIGVYITLNQNGFVRSSYPKRTTKVYTNVWKNYVNISWANKCYMYYNTVKDNARQKQTSRSILSEQKKTSLQKLIQQLLKWFWSKTIPSYRGWKKLLTLTTKLLIASKRRSCIASKQWGRKDRDTSLSENKYLKGERLSKVGYKRSNLRLRLIWAMTASATAIAHVQNWN